MLCEVFAAVTVKNAVFCDMKTLLLIHRGHVSATQSSQLVLCKIWGFHGGDYEECRLLGCDAVRLLCEALLQTFLARSFCWHINRSWDVSLFRLWPTRGHHCVLMARSPFRLLTPRGWRLPFYRVSKFRNRGDTTSKCPKLSLGSLPETKNLSVCSLIVEHVKFSRRRVNRPHTCFVVWLSWHKETSRRLLILT
jgi:hypothetical protein